jgi:hypothetical protein
MINNTDLHGGNHTTQRDATGGDAAEHTDPGLPRVEQGSVQLALPTRKPGPTRASYIQNRCDDRFVDVG